MSEMSEQGKLEAIWIKRAKLGPMDPHNRATLVAGKGLVNNANQGGKRQVTIISKEAWTEVEQELSAEIDPRARRANLLVSGISLMQTRGKILQIGDRRLQIAGETRPCERMDQAHAGLRAALDPEWRGGVFAEVLDDGEIVVGDAVRWME